MYWVCTRWVVPRKSQQRVCFSWCLQVWHADPHRLTHSVSPASRHGPHMGMCFRILPGGGAPSGKAREHTHFRHKKFAHCVQRHCVPLHLCATVYHLHLCAIARLCVTPPLRVFCQHAINLLPTCDQLAPNIPSTCCQHAVNLLPTCDQLPASMPSTCCQHAINLLPTYRQHAANLLPTCRQHAAYP